MKWNSIDDDPTTWPDLEKKGSGVEIEQDGGQRVSGILTYDDVVRTGEAPHWLVEPADGKKRLFLS